VSRRRCCGGSEPPADVPCGTTSTVPLPWLDRIYTLAISGSFGPTMMQVTFNGQGQDCQAVSEPNCQEELLAFYWIEPCCGENESGSALRKVVLQGSTNFSGSFEFDSTGRTGSTASCTRKIPVSYSSATQWSAICAADMPGPTVVVTEISECSKRITNCADGSSAFGASCLDVSQIRVNFFANIGANYTRRENDCTTSDRCFSAFLTGSAIYQRAKSASDTHVAVGAYDMVWSSTPYADDCGPGLGYKSGCPGVSQFPSSITVGIKP